METEVDGYVNYDQESEARHTDSIASRLLMFVVAFVYVCVCLYVCVCVCMRTCLPMCY